MTYTEAAKQCIPAGAVGRCIRHSQCHTGHCPAAPCGRILIWQLQPGKNYIFFPFEVETGGSCWRLDVRGPWTQVRVRWRSDTCLQLGHRSQRRRNPPMLLTPYQAGSYREAAGETHSTVLRSKTAWGCPDARVSQHRQVPRQSFFELGFLGTKSWRPPRHPRASTRLEYHSHHFGETRGPMWLTASSYVDTNG